MVFPKGIFLLPILLSSLSKSYIMKDILEIKRLAKNQSIDTLPKLAVNPDHIIFFVSTKKFNYEKLDEILENKKENIETGKPIKIIIHGFQSNSGQPWVKNMTAAFLRDKTNQSVISVDWSKIANRLTREYPKVVSHMISTSEVITKKILELENLFQTPSYQIHMLGHSLGAHIAGMIGLELKYIYGKEIGRISGLDPALPLFENASKRHRLDPTDASFVDVIHTDAGKLGIKEPMGTADFYPNGGVSPQPACSANFIDVFIGCSHSLAHDYYTESIRSRKFKAKKCSNFNTYLKGQCDDYETQMGEHVDTMARGRFYLTVNKFIPYARNGKI